MMRPGVRALVPLLHRSDCSAVAPVVLTKKETPHTRGASQLLHKWQALGRSHSTAPATDKSGAFQADTKVAPPPPSAPVATNCDPRFSSCAALYHGPTTSQSAYLSFLRGHRVVPTPTLQDRRRLSLLRRSPPFTSPPRNPTQASVTAEYEKELYHSSTGNTSSLT